MKQTDMNGRHAKMYKRYPVLKKKGVVSPNGEMTPFVFHGKLMRLESVASEHCADTRKESILQAHAIIRDVESGKVISSFGHGSYFFDAYVENEHVYVFGTLSNSKEGWYGGDTIMLFESDDLVNWTQRVFFHKKGWLMYNHSLTKDDDGYVFMVELSKPRRIVGKEVFTFVFAKTYDLKTLKFYNLRKSAYPIGRYGGGPKLHYVNGWYYFLSLEMFPGPIYGTYIVRTKDFQNWVFGKYNPFLFPSNEDFTVSPDAADITDEMREEIATMYNSNESDPDFCEYNGKVIIDYCPGNQLGYGYICEAEYDGTLQEMLENFFD